MNNFYLPKPPRVGKSKNPDRERFEISLDPTKDKDVIERLSKESNKSSYVKRLIRADIKKAH